MLHACNSICTQLDAIMQVQQKTTMKQDKRYLDLLQRAGISVNDMVKHLSSLGIGTPQQWHQAITTGAGIQLSDLDRRKGMQYIKSNPQLAQIVQQLLSA